MKIKKLAAFCFVNLLCLNIFCQNKKVDFWSNVPDEELSVELVNQMSDEELLAQIFMFGWAGKEPSTLLNSWVVERGLGSVKVFGWNTEDLHDVAKSVKMLQEEAQSRPLKIPLFVATDQEGGWIRHVKGTTSDTPGNMAIGSSGYPMDAYYSGYYINKEIASLGINMNFAPTVDIYSNLESSVIGPRSFSSNSQNVGILGEAFAKGSMAAGVIPTAKHFPGHGDTSLDSHGRLPQIMIDENTFYNRELIPFKYLIDSDIPAIMSGHLSFPKIVPDGTPASLSKKMLQEILRGKLGYKGLIITDDMMMNGAISFAGSFQKGVTMAIEAGNDIVLSSTTAGLNDSSWTVNLDRMKTDEAFKNRVKEAATHVILAKLKYFKGKNPAPLYPDETKIEENIPDKEGQKFFLEQACRSVSLQQCKCEFPYKPAAGEKILIASPYTNFVTECRKRYPDAASYYIAYDRSNETLYEAWNLTNVAQSYDTIIINVWDRHSASIARRFKGMGKKVIVISIMSPVYVLEDFDFADIILCGYSYSDYSFNALFGALNGEYEIQGKLPL